METLGIPNMRGTPKHTDKARAYGDLFVTENATSVSVADGTLTQFLLFAKTEFGNHTNPDIAQNHIEIKKQGVYYISCSTSFSGDPSVDWSFHVHMNNNTIDPEPLHFNRKLGAGGDIGSATMTGLVNCNVGDTVEVWYMHGAGVNKSITIQDCTLSVFKIG